MKIHANTGKKYNTSSIKVNYELLMEQLIRIKKQKYPLLNFDEFCNKNGIKSQTLYPLRTNPNCGLKIQKSLVMAGIDLKKIVLR